MKSFHGNFRWSYRGLGPENLGKTWDMVQQSTYCFSWLLHAIAGFSERNCDTYHHSTKKMCFSGEKCTEMPRTDEGDVCNVDAVCITFISVHLCAQRIMVSTCYEHQENMSVQVLNSEILSASPLHRLFVQVVLGNRFTRRPAKSCQILSRCYLGCMRSCWGVGCSRPTKLHNVFFSTLSSRNGSSAMAKLSILITQIMRLPFKIYLHKTEGSYGIPQNTWFRVNATTVKSIQRPFQGRYISQPHTLFFNQLSRPQVHSQICPRVIGNITDINFLFFLCATMHH